MSSKRTLTNAVENPTPSKQPRTAGNAPPEHDVNDWSTEEVYRWAVNVVSAAHAQKLVAQEISGKHLLNYTIEELISDGFPRGPAMDLLEAIQRLKAAEPAQTYTPNPELDRISFNTDAIDPSYLTAGFQMVLDFVGQLVCDRGCAKFYVLQDRDDPNSTHAHSDEEINDVIQHFRDPQVKLEVEKLDATIFGYTSNKKRPAICVNSMLVEALSDEDRKKNAFVILVITILHELSHYKLQREERRDSPQKFKWSRHGESESGTLIQQLPYSFIFRLLGRKRVVWGANTPP
eukprot:TRINITY_DN2748_c0_g1_i1.p1 TRINITY_DN2748_c0_g1~~TRINITY_DN2748_c0_g1_i1.p1  ORF type:complete len:290 (+),score=55.48 TRINITY_DN2748_c0_g1_i1:1-870(+)